MAASLFDIITGNVCQDCNGEGSHPEVKKDFAIDAETGKKIDVTVRRPCGTCNGTGKKNG